MTVPPLPDVPFYDPGAYWLVRWLFKRGLAVIYLGGFLVAANQFRPLAGEEGLLPLDRYRERFTFRERPSLFHWYPNDTVIGWAAWTGVALSVVALVGVPGLLPVSGTVATLFSMVLWLTLWALYLSFVNAGQVWYGFGWESMLLETGFLAIFLGAGDLATPAIVIWLLRWVLFRNMLGAGLIKLRGDECWRNLTCLDYHYETQPMPNPVSWYVHHAPAWFHRFGVIVNHVAEILIPFAYFAPQPVAAIAGLITIGFQGWLALTGNFSWLNWLTIVLAVPTLTDPLLSGVLPVAPPSAPSPVPLWLFVLTVALAIFVAYRSIDPVLNLVGSDQAMNRSFDPLHLVNTYGAFGSITRKRYEIVIEGTLDEHPDADSDWREYEVPGKPTDPGQRPPQIAPYHHRLGWQLWFAAMTGPNRNPWIYRLCQQLLEGDKQLRRILANDPFDGEAPGAVRVSRYRYRFTTPAERDETGNWWHRERVETYLDAVSLSNPQFRLLLRRRGWLEE